jgi:hypothetical protein
MTPDSQGSPDLLVRAWRQREEIVHPRLFGELSSGIYTLSEKTFEPFGSHEIDPRWLHCGVFASPPSAKRSTWAYVSSGLSNPWWDDSTRKAGFAGLGCELLLELPEPADWGILHVQNIMAFQLLLVAGHYPEKPRLQPWDRIPLKQPLDAMASLLRWFLVVPTDDATRTFHVESGRVSILTLIGLTDAEAEYAREQGGDRLVTLLRQQGAYPVTDRARRSLLSAA